jgi:hypothetical protein
MVQNIALVLFGALFVIPMVRFLVWVAVEGEKVTPVDRVDWDLDNLDTKDER